MQKRKLLVALVAIVSMGYFSSCVEDYTSDANPTIDVVSPAGDTILVAIGDSVNFTLDLSSENTLASLKTLASGTGVEIVNGDKTFSLISEETVVVTVKLDNTITPNSCITITFTVTDQGHQGSIQKVICAEGLTAAKDFTWERIGATTATGLTDFGLSWTSNGADGKFAIIKKDADKFVLLEPAQWTTITSFKALKAAIDAADNMESWKGVSAEASNTYDFTLGTIKGGKYYLIHVTKGVVKSVTAGTQITITGQYKE